MLKKIFLLCLFILGISYAQSVSDSSLILYYSFNGNTFDGSGNEINGRPNNVQLIEDKNHSPSKAYYFEGVESYIEIPNVPEIKVNFPMSISCWIKLSEYQVPIFTNDFQNDVYTGVLFFVSSYGVLGVTIGNGGPIGPDSRHSKVGYTVLNKGEWYHVTCIIKDFYDIDFYINGALEYGDYSGLGDSLAYTDSYGAIGKADQNVFLDPAYYKGVIDEFYFFNKSLSLDEVESLYANYNRNLELSIPTVSANEGDSIVVSVNLNLPMDFYFSSFSFKIFYPAEALEFIGISDSGTILEDKDWLILSNDSELSLNISGAGAFDIGVGGNLLNLNFIVSPNIEQHLINLEFISAIFDDGTTFVEFTNGVIIVTTNILVGDVNNDSIISAYDASNILKYLVGLINFSDNQFIAADVSLDSTISTMDAKLILDYVNETIDTLPFQLAPELKFAQGDINFSDPIYDQNNLIVPLLVSNANNIISYSGQIYYEPQELEFQSLFWGNSLLNNYNDFNTADGILSFAGFGNSVSQDTVFLANLVFQVKEFHSSESSLIFKKIRWNESQTQNNVDIIKLNLLTSAPSEQNYDFSLAQNYPNPFNPTTEITYTIPETKFVSLKLYDILGNEIRTIDSGLKRAGVHRVFLDASDLTSGVYLYRLIMNNYTSVKKMIVVK